MAARAHFGRSFVQPGEAYGFPLPRVLPERTNALHGQSLPTLHSLEDDLKGHWSIWVNGNWRLTFTFEGTDAILVDYQDYH